VGFMTVERLAGRGGVEFRKERFWNSLRARIDIRGEPATLIKPLSYVNLSGPVARKVAEDLEVAVKDVLVVLDDFYLETGRLRLRRAGGDGGHNGMDSIIRAFRTDRVARLRIGIGEPHPGGATNHVLSRFRPEERQVIEEAVRTAADAVEVWAVEGPEEAMNRYNKNKAEES
jgi:PTH1 family peptidyl-tRNA hydrolase